MIWIVHYLPESMILLVTSIMLGLGILLTLAGWLSSYIKNAYITSYRLPIQIAGAILLAAGVYFHGGYRIEMEWRTKVKEAEKKITEYENRVPEVNERVVTKYKNVIKYVEKQVKENIQLNQEKAAAINEGCTLSDDAIEAYNRAIQGPKGVEE